LTSVVIVSGRSISHSQSEEEIIDTNRWFRPVWFSWHQICLRGF